MRELRKFLGLNEGKDTSSSHVYAHIKFYDRTGEEHYKIKVPKAKIDQILNDDPASEHDSDIHDDFNHSLIHSCVHSTDDGQTIQKHKRNWKRSNSLSASFEEGVVGIHPTKEGATRNMHKADSPDEGEWR